jgi:hypothetical protein
MMFATVTHPVEGLSLETLLVLKMDVSNFLSGYVETNNMHNETTANFVPENVNKK